MNIKQTSEDILNKIFSRRKLVPEESSSNSQPYRDTARFEEKQHHLQIIEQLVAKQLPIKMILPAYPGKSPNRNKTLGYFPDLAEHHSIDILSQLCDEINEIYQPGAQVIICSDGYVFSDLVKIPDDKVEAYTNDIIKYYSLHYPNKFAFFDIKDAYPELNCLDSAREELMVNFGSSLITLSKKAKYEAETQSMYKGITRFLFEDFCGLQAFNTSSKTQIQKMAKKTSLRVIQRSNAWSDLLEHHFPDAVRLSIHPQFRVSKKIGIKLGHADDGWRTPWHSVAVQQGDDIQFLRRSMVDENRYRLIFNNGRPSHYLQQYASSGEHYV